jgi:hypothetical protein
MIRPEASHWDTLPRGNWLAYFLRQLPDFLSVGTGKGMDLPQRDVTGSQRRYPLTSDPRKRGSFLL